MIALYELHPLSGLQGGFLGNQETTELRPCLMHTCVCVCVCVCVCLCVLVCVLHVCVCVYMQWRRQGGALGA